MGNSLLIFLDPGYLDGIGHYENYARRLRWEAQQSGVDLLHYVNRDVWKSSIEKLGLIPLFPYRAFIGAGLYRDAHYLEHTIIAFASKLRIILRKAVSRARKGYPVRLFMYTGHPRLLPVIGKLMNSPELDGIDIGFQFNLFYVSNRFAFKTDCADYFALLHELDAALEKADPSRRVQLFADSLRIINVYHRFFSRPINLLPIPFADNCRTNGHVPQSKAGICLGYMGYTQAKQGYHFIRRLYHDLLSHPDYRTVNFKVRHNLFNIQGAMAEDLRDLLSARERIENTINYMSPDDYELFFQDCDMLLIPHSRLDYPVQTSGMLIDALCRGKPVVVPENTWLADQVARYGAGICFSGTNYDSFRDAAYRAIDRFPQLKKESGRNLTSFIQFHSSENLFCILFRDPGPTERQKMVEPTGKADRIELLSLRLLENKTDAVEMVYAEKIFRRKHLGWHYMLDLVWIVSQLKDLPADALVLDVGAGDGLLQYVLLRMGLRAISVDFTIRQGPADVDWIALSDGKSYDNSYLRHLKDNYSTKTEATSQERLISSREAFLSFIENESARLIFYRSDISEMALLMDGQVDAVVSVSALEHNDFDKTFRSVDECLRVLKPGGVMLSTVSAAADEDWFHKPSKGWCYSEASLRRLFQLDPAVVSNFAEYQRVLDELMLPGCELHVQLAPFYFNSGNNGMPWGVWSPKYLPVGIRKNKMGTSDGNA